MTAAFTSLTASRSAHYLTAMISVLFSKIFLGRRLLAIAVAVAVLFAGVNFRCIETLSLRTSGDVGTVVTMEQKTSPDSGKGSVADHYCQGCVVFVATESDDGFSAPITSRPSISDTPDLVGALSDFPARPPRTEIQLF
jgi:hypothetical protein